MREPGLRLLPGVVVLALAAGTAAAQSAGQSPASGTTPHGFTSSQLILDTPTYKTSTRLVVLDVVVTDQSGAPVRGLHPDDFRVLENGREQKVKVFEEHDNAGLPVSSNPYLAPEPGTSMASNAGQELPGSAYSVVLLDALNTASSDQGFARAQLKKVIAELPPGSRVAIFVLRGELHMVQGFTTETGLLLKAMEGDKSTLSGPWFNDPDMVLLSTAPGPAPDAGNVMSGNAAPGGNMGPATYLRSMATADEEGLTSELRGAKTLVALSALARYLSMLPGRKNLIWLAGSFPFDLTPDEAPMHELALQMDAGHIAVYPVDVRGLVGGFYGASTSSRPSTTQGGEVAGSQFSRETVMQTIAYETGGRAIYNDNGIHDNIIESLKQGENYYTLAYSPADKNWNGKYRKVEIKSPLKGLKLYYRRGYLAEDPEKPGRILPESMSKFTVAMLRGAPERAEIGLTVKATPTGAYIEKKDRKPRELKDRALPAESQLTGSAEVYALDCTVDPSTVVFQKTKDGMYATNLSFTLVVYDADGKLLNAETGMNVQPLTEAQYQVVMQQGLTIRRKLELPLGRVFLRVGVHDLERDKVGAIEMPITVSTRTVSTGLGSS